jgi:predicted transposase YbfD/YdcC
MLIADKNKQISIFTSYAAVKDPRDNRGKRYKLLDLLIMTIYGILNGYDDFEKMADFLKLNESYFKRLLLIEKTPSHDCLSDLFAVIDPQGFMDVFVEWISEITASETGRIIALDGKAVRSARDKINGGNTPYILSAYLSEIGISLGQVAVGKKTNEIKSIPELLKLLDIKGCYITIDAMGTQEAVARKIVELEGHYVLKVKKNQKVLLRDIETCFSQHLKNVPELSPKIIFETTDFEKNHGREEHREYYLLHNASCITDKEKWITVASIGMVRVYRYVKGEMEITDHFYIMDTQMSMELFMRTTRNHWNIECGLHWRLDVIMNEDRSRNRVGHSVSNLAAVRKIAFNLVRLDSSFGKISFEKKLSRYRYDFENIEYLIFNVIPVLKK